ncbi:MAG TPA: hypothetical protein VKV26_20215 [Dehalococcoidia bacterium]|nr:hypothetical protein [Dehalococcoidia bacterium]
MTRRAYLLVAAAAMALIGGAARPDRPLASALSVTYPAGWNLVGGPAGTTLTGASGKLYTFGFRDKQYESLASDTPLTGGLGYWAYFPSGGSATLGESGPCVIAVPIGAGEWVMVGHPWATGTATVRGAERVLKYQPGSGYVAGVTLRPGEAAWAYSHVATSAAVVVDDCPTINSVPPSPPVQP